SCACWSGRDVSQSDDACGRDAVRLLSGRKYTRRPCVRAQIKGPRYFSRPTPPSQRSGQETAQTGQILEHNRAWPPVPDLATAHEAQPLLTLERRQLGARSWKAAICAAAYAL